MLDCINISYATMPEFSYSTSRIDWQILSIRSLMLKKQLQCQFMQSGEHGITFFIMDIINKKTC